MHASRGRLSWHTAPKGSAPRSRLGWPPITTPPWAPEAVGGKDAASVWTSGNAAHLRNLLLSKVASTPDEATLYVLCHSCYCMLSMFCPWYRPVDVPTCLGSGRCTAASNTNFSAEQVPGTCRRRRVDGCASHGRQERNRLMRTLVLHHSLRRPQRPASWCAWRSRSQSRRSSKACLRARLRAGQAATRALQGCRPAARLWALRACRRGLSQVPRQHQRCHGLALRDYMCAVRACGQHAHQASA